jgi:hypothetical protein
MAVKFATDSFYPLEAFKLIAGLAAPFARQAQNTGIHTDLDVGRIDAGHVGLEYKSVFFLNNINSRYPIGYRIVSVGQRCTAARKGQQIALHEIEK